MMSLRVCTVFIALVCVATAVHDQIYQVQKNGNYIKIEKVTDSTLQHALNSIYSKSSVKELDLSGNLLSQISAANLWTFTNLELLNLSSNVLYESVNLAALNNLKTIDLNNNFVNELIVGPSIETLHAANNNISRVTCTGDRQTHQPKRIYLANNKIDSLVLLGQECRSNVQFLNLKLNEIDMVDFAELAESAHTLEYLYLQYNFIFDVKNTQNVVFSRLHTLDLSSNKVAFMGPEFNAAVTAQSINLSNNKLVMVSADLTFSTTITSFDLRGNGFQCDSLKNMFNRNKQLLKVATSTVRSSTGQEKESCHTVGNNTMKYRGPYCCEDLSAPFADRLIELKRKQHALFSSRPSESEREECVRESAARQREVAAIQQQYRTTLNEETRKKQEKIVLTQNMKALEDKWEALQGSYEELKSVLAQAANELQLGVTEKPDLLQLLRDIVQRYEDLNTEEQKKQNAHILDWEMYQKKETQLLEDNARLKKVNEETELALQKANATLQGLIIREQALAKALSTAQN
ncbi:uncharacterized protein LOC128304601 [Anopheles moucheti]|uniref:uncharacterized protein LOC128304601 n=1 Tax=Anopheles moucheti TaxID=186751 RepID=UPI0022F08C9E|nr:uncharacterized protein LOC128304601 [Anopheles moucheti]